ncbi:MAG: DUF3572 domain-containing protein [Pseudomonadota bacterium]
MQASGRIPNIEEAEKLSIQALGFLANEENRLQKYISLTGLDPATLRDAATDPRFLASVLEYVMQDEALLLEFAEMQAIDPASVPSAHARLSSPGPA